MNTGTILITASLMLSIAALFFLFKTREGNELQIVSARRIFYATGMLIFFAVLILLSSFLNNEFQYAYIYNNSERGMSLIYKIAALWAGNEGSFLIWLFILNLCGLFIIYKKDKFETPVLASIILAQVFILAILLVKNPFTYVWNYFPGEMQPGEIPGDGNGMNPLLLDPWMVAHPPVLFLGYASSTVIFGYAIAALINREYDEWLKPAYKWLLFSTLTLGIGIFMGGYWAYKVLGWGGYWGWDPVENSSLIPWIISVALLHGMILQKRKSLLKRGNIAMALGYFLLVIYSTFLTRSGVLSDFSVHSFGKSDVTIYLASGIAVFLGISMYLFYKRFNEIESSESDAGFFTFETVLTYGIITLAIFAAVIFAGTSLPLFSGFMANPLSVTEKFYNNISIPFGVMILGFITVFVLIIGKFEKRELAVCAGTAAAAAVLSNVFFTFNAIAYIFSLISFFLVSLLLFHFYRSRKSWLLPAGLAHIGIAVFVIGVIISGIHSWTEQKKVSIGETVQAGPVSITLKGFTEADKSTVDAVIKKGMRTAEASMYYYIDSKTQSLYREPYIMSGVAGDIYITPQQYNFAAINYSTATLHEKEEKQVSGLTVKFNGFITNNMGAQGMIIRADILIDGMKYFPAVRFSNGETEQLNQTVQGSRTLRIEGIDATHKSVRIYLSPIPGAVIPPDFAVFDISMKRFIWVVWLGTILIASGFTVAMVRAFKKS